MSAPIRGRSVEWVMRAKWAVCHDGPGPVPDWAAEALDEVCRANEGLVVKLARCRGVPPGRDRNDRLQVAWYGLIRAVRRYDPSRGASFSTALYYSVLGALLEDEEEANWPIRVSDRAMYYHRCARDGRPRHFYNVAAVETALTRVANDEAAYALELVASTEPDPVDAAAESETKERIRVAMDRLCSDEREALVRHYGLGGDTPETQVAIAADWGVKKQRVEFVVRTARQKLAAVLGEEGVR